MKCGRICLSHGGQLPVLHRRKGSQHFMNQAKFHSTFPILLLLKSLIRHKRYPLFSYSNLYTTVVRYVHRVDIIAPDSSITSIFSLSVFCKPFSHIVGLKFSNYFSYHTYCMLMLCLPNANIFPF